MENVGAVKELSKITSNLEARISELEQNNERDSLLKNNSSGIALSELTGKYSNTLARHYRMTERNGQSIELSTIFK